MGRKPQRRPKHLGKKLESIRKQLEITQAKMAELLMEHGAEDTTHSGYVAEFETGKRIPSVFTLLAYSKIVGVSINALVDDELDLPKGRESARNRVTR